MLFIAAISAAIIPEANGTKRSNSFEDGHGPSLSFNSFHVLSPERAFLFCVAILARPNAERRYLTVIILLHGHVVPLLMLR